MNVLHVSTMDNRGAGGACVRTHLNLLSQGVDSNLLVLAKTRNDIPNSSSILDIINHSTSSKIQHRVKKFLHDQKIQKKLKGKPQSLVPFSFPNSIYDITKHPSYKKADIITLHWVANFLDFSSFFPKNHKPVTWRMPDMFPFSGGNHYDLGFPKNSYQDLIEENLQIKSQSLQKKTIYPIPLCNWMKDISEKSSLFKKFSHTLIPNGLDTHTFQPRNKKFSRDLLGLPQNQKIILFVANVVENKRKGFYLLEEALMHLEDNQHIHLAILGHGSNKSLSNRNTTLLGHIQDERLLSIAYSAADLFVIPALEDNLPNTVIESIACGTPVVGFNIGGVPDMVIQGKNGFLCDKIDSVSLGIALKEALETQFDLPWIRSDAVNRFDQAVQANRYIQLYEQLLA